MIDAQRRTTHKESQTQVQAYLYFDGRTEAAIEFYRSAVDAQVDMLMRLVIVHQ